MMPKTGTPLSAVAVRNLRSAGKYYDQHGLFLRIEPTGSRRWVQRLSIDGRQREMGLGSADLITLAEARSIALIIRSWLNKAETLLPQRKRSRLFQPFLKQWMRSLHCMLRHGAMRNMQLNSGLR